MADDFLYLLGAGASAEAVPLVADIPQRLLSFAEQLRNVWPANAQGVALMDKTDPFWGILKERFRNDVTWLANEARFHASIDTYAKKLFLKNDMPNLKRLKIVLSCYLIVEQGQRPVDKRYDSFFASVLTKNTDGALSIPENLHFITWNYDTQMEKAYFGFCDSSDQVYKAVTFNKRIQRINGYCGTFPAGHVGEAFNSIWSSDQESIWKNAIKLYSEYVAESKSADPDIRFSWETGTQTRYANLEADFKAATSLIVIGYSFPYFNRDVDKRILNALPIVKNVYLQYPAGQHAGVAERISAMAPHLPKPRLIEDTRLFFIPNDFVSP